MFSRVHYRLFAAGATAVVLLPWSLFETALAKDQIIRLGGIRDVTATISQSDEAYQIRVEMLPVKAFDPATNKVLNLSKGRAYVARALAKYLKADNLVIRGLKIHEAAGNGEPYYLAAVVPRDGVLAGANAADAKERPEPAGTPSVETAESKREPATGMASRQHEIRLSADATAADFVNRKADYLDTIVQLREALSKEGNSVESQSSKAEDFYDSIGSIEERTEAAFKALAGEINKDKLLLSVEQEELRPALKKARSEVLDSLKATVARFDEREEKTKKEKKK